MTREELLKGANEPCGVGLQIDMAIDTMPRLTTALLKYKKHCNDALEGLYRRDVQDEIVNAHLALEQMKQVFGYNWHKTYERGALFQQIVEE